jgi:hypothetical protein
LKKYVHKSYTCIILFLQKVPPHDEADWLSGTFYLGNAPHARAPSYLGNERLNILEYDNDARRVLADPAAPYSGVKVSEKTLVPSTGALLGSTRLDWWLTHVPPPQKK